MAGKTVAVVGAGPAGLAALKCLREEGFEATAFEARDDIGGVWCYSTELGTTTCLPDTLINSSKYTSHFSDFPFPDDYPTYPSATLMHRYFKSYIEHFGMANHIKLKARVTTITRDEATSKWCLSLETEEGTRTELFDKVVVSNGMVYLPLSPQLEGSELFEGTLIHGRDYKSPHGFENKNVMVLGIGNTAADVAVDLAGKASNIYLSHRRGCVMLSRFRPGAPVELSVNYNTLRILNLLEDKAGFLAAKAIDYLLQSEMDKSWEIDPSWGLKPVPSGATTLPCINEHLIPCLAEGSVLSVTGLKRFVGPKSVELEDGTILDNIDAVVLCTGYTHDMTVTPWLKRSSPPKYDGEPMPRLYLYMFPPEYADSIAFLNTCGVLDCAWIVSELCAMAVAQLWSGKSAFPSRRQMESSIEKTQKLNAYMRQMNPNAEPVLKARELYRFLHTTAGTGLAECLGWGWSGWKFWVKDREMSKLLGWGVVTPCMYRLVETGKRRAWDGAREAIKKTNEDAKKLDKTPNKFTLKDAHSKRQLTLQR